MPTESTKSLKGKRNETQTIRVESRRIMNNTPTPETDAVIAGDMGDSTHLSDMENLCRKLERERDEAKDLLSYFITHYELLDYSEATLDELEKVAVSLWGVVKERNQLRKVCDWFATSVVNRDLYGDKPAIAHYNSLPHVIERKTK